MFALLAAAGAAVAATGAWAAAPPIKTPSVFFAKYHLSGYGVYHHTDYVAYTAAPCKVGGGGGGDSGTLRDDTTIRWETVKPAVPEVERIGSNQPGMLLPFPPGADAPGIIATATVSHDVTDDLVSIACRLDGSEVRAPDPYVPERVLCGSHTYESGYYAFPVWPHVASTAPGERIAVGVTNLPATERELKRDWKDCWKAVNSFNNETFVNEPFPFSKLPRKLHKPETVTIRGHETVLDETRRQNGQGGTIHDYDAYHETNYLTWVRIS